MPYQNIGTPRFYVNALEWGSSVGFISDLKPIFRTLPVNSLNVLNTTVSAGGYGHGIPFMGSERDFIAYLGHNFHSAAAGATHAIALHDSMDPPNPVATGTVPQGSLVNRGEQALYTNSYKTSFNGFSIGIFSGYNFFDGLSVVATTPIIWDLLL